MRRFILVLSISIVALNVDASAELEEAIRACDASAAVEALRRSDRSDPARRLYDAARVDLLKGETNDAVEKLEQSVERSPRRSDYHLWYSRALFAKAGESSAWYKPFLARKAIKELERALEIDPANDDAAIDLMLIHLRVPILGGGDDAAEQIVHDLNRRRSPYAPLANGILAYEHQRWDRAEKELRRAVAILDDPRRALFWVGFLDQRLGRWEDAFSVHEELLILSPNDPRVWYEFGRTADFSGLRTDAAASMIRRYLEADLPSGAATKDEARKLYERLRSR